MAAALTWSRERSPYTSLTAALMTRSRRLSVGLSVRHTLALYQNGDTWKHEIYGCPKDSSLS